MRKAFSMITAIFVIVIMATVAILVFNTSGKIVKETTVQYRKEQAKLLARSYTELAVMAVMNYNRTTSNDCIEQINGVVNALTPGSVPLSGSSSINGVGYEIETRIQYLGNGLPTGCTKILNSAPIQTDYNNTTPPAPDELAAIIVDVYVKYKDTDMVDTYITSHGTAPTATQIPWITYHRRTLQKI